MSLPWVEVYRPKSRDDLVGNEASINGLKLFLSRWRIDNTIKGALLLGPAGSGKTSSVYAIANELGFTVTEVNASDTRKKSSIQDILEPATQYSDLSMSVDQPSANKIILMDEIDGLSGRYDRGGLSEFIKVLKKSRFPIIATANDPDSSNIQKLQKRKEIRTFIFNRLGEFDVFELLLKISEKEQLDVNEIHLEMIAASVSGDIRAAINELESHVSGSTLVQLENRDKMQTLVTIINDLFRAKSHQEARSVLSNAPSDYYMLLLFLFDETAAQCRTPQELVKAYEQLAQADLVYNRIMRTQNWSLLKYFFDFIGPGLALARENKQHKRINSLKNIPSSFISRGKAKRVNSQAITVAPKLSQKLHISENQFINNQFSFFQKIILGQNGSEIAAWLDLDDDEISSLTKGHPDSDLALNIDEARTKIGKIRSEQGKNQEGTMSGLDYFSFSKKSPKEQETEDEEDVPSDDSEIESPEEEDTEGQLSLDDFF